MSEEEEFILSHQVLALRGANGEAALSAPDWAYDDADTDDCPECGGEGGHPCCCEDTCPHIYGEEGCDDPACWRRCSVCRGKGYVGGEP